MVLTKLAGAAGLAALSVAAGAQTMPPPPGILTVHFAGLRSTKGLIHACLTRNPAHFPACEKDPAALKASIAAATDAHVEFPAVPPGDYALMVMHDENSNGKLDTMFGIPREGVGFSRDPVMRFGPPKWDAARFHVPSGPSELTVTLKYFL